MKFLRVLCATLAFFTYSLASAQSEPPTVRIGVLTLFHPKTLTLSTPRPTTLLLDGTPHPLTHLATIKITTTGLTVDGQPAQTLTLAENTFTLTVPSKLTRTYRAALTITTHHGALESVLTLDPELAVASIVAAESPPGAPFAALQAQAVASRSFLLANPHAHPDFDACDTTHCQFLRAPPPPESPAARATQATRHIVLTWSPSGIPHIVRAMYSRSCGGHTHAHPSSNPADYPFYPVACAFCLRHPERWSRPAAPATLTESGRLAWNRTHGWAAIPSNSHTQTADSLEGTGTGHGVGLCQLGSADMAAAGEDFPHILAHFFPNTTLTKVP